LTLPPLVLGLAAFVYTGWPSEHDPHQDAAYALPLLLRDMVPAWVGLFGLAAIVGAVTSSFSASILSAGSMFSWNVFYRLSFRSATLTQMKHVIRGSIVLLGLGAVVLALRVGSVQKLWFFCADLIFVLLFPQLIMALFDPKVNRVGSIVAFVASLTMRLGAGEPLLGLPAFIDYPGIFESVLPGPAADWIDGAGNVLAPFRTVAMLVGLVLLPLVSRLTARLDPPRRLRRLAE
jgi:high affinity choline transporter 7